MHGLPEASQAPVARSRDEPARERAWWADRQVLSWAMLDFAYTPFTVLVVTIGYSTYFKEVVAQGARGGDFLWGLAASISMAIVAVTAPSTGAYADASGLKRRLLLAYTAFTIFCTALLGTVERGMIFRGMLVFILANVGFQGAQVFYNAFLPQISDRKTVGAVSGLGFAMGYAGALVSLLAVLPFFSQEFARGELDGMRILFPFVAVFYAVFSIPTFVYLKDSRPAVGTTTGLSDGLVRLRSTFSQIRRYGAPFRFLLSYLLFMDAIMTMITFTSIYARDTLGLEMDQIVELFLLSQLTAIPGAIFFGWFADRRGRKLTLSLILLLWAALIVVAISEQNAGLRTILIVGLLAGIGIGSLQSVSRSLMAELTPADREGEFFGFYTLVGRMSAVIGPVVFGTVSSLTGNQRLALGTLLLMILGGLVILQGVSTRGREPPLSEIGSM